MKKLIFIPYHDHNDFQNSKILTREYSLLKILMNSNDVELYSITKPRTFFDKKHLKFAEYPKGSVEFEVNELIEKSNKIDLYKFFDIRFFAKRRAWWIDGYREALQELKGIVDAETYIYTNNPFSFSLVSELKNEGATVIFDMMDNFAKHPSLNKSERNAAYKCYKKYACIADYYCCNSNETKVFCKDHFNIKADLIKNGVFPNKLDSFKSSKLMELEKRISYYKTSIGYIGKLGKRIDADLVNDISKELKNSLFVFIGPHLKGQKNKKLISVFSENENILDFGAIPSYEIYSYLSIFDILIIPHSIGDSENGGDPLKLYQYLNSKKKIISTSIIGVEEFKDYITISNNSNEWIQEIKKFEKTKQVNYEIPKRIYWETRTKPLVKFITEDKNRHRKEIYD